MTFDYRRFLPDPPKDCCDPELFRLLNEFEFVRWQPDCGERKSELQSLLWSESLLARAEAALEDRSPYLRFHAGQLLLWVRRDEACDVALQLLDDLDEEVRGGTARLLQSVREPRLEQTLITIAKGDLSPYVRGGAATGLGGQNPVAAIPVLLELLDHDHEMDDAGHSPSSCAATALDEMMDTEWTQKRYRDGLRGLQLAGVDHYALREQAAAYLRHCLEKQSDGL